MAKSYPVTIFGGRETHRNQLRRAAQNAAEGSPTNAVQAALRAVLDTGLVYEAQNVGGHGRRISIRVKEAPFVKGFHFSGNEKIRTKKVEAQLAEIEIGKRVNAAVIQREVERIKALYQKSGLTIPRVEVEVEGEGKHGTVLLFSIVENSPPPSDDNLQDSRFRQAKRPQRLVRKIKSSDDAIDGSISNEDQSWPVVSSVIANSARNDRAVATEIPGADVVSGSVDERSDLVSVNTSSWTGRYTTDDQVRALRVLAPKVRDEIDLLIEMVETYRFNDEPTQDALSILRSLHDDLGQLIEALEQGKHKPLLVRILRKNEKLKAKIANGANLFVVAPALTYGISAILSTMGKTVIDNQLLGSVYAGVLAYPALSRFAKK